MRSQGISQFHLHTSRSSTNGMNHTCLFLPSQSWSLFTDPGGMEGSQPELVLIYRPWRDGRLSWPGKTSVDLAGLLLLCSEHVIAAYRLDWMEYTQHTFFRYTWPFMGRFVIHMTTRWSVNARADNIVGQWHSTCRCSWFIAIVDFSELMSVLTNETGLLLRSIHVTLSSSMVFVVNLLW